MLSRRCVFHYTGHRIPRYGKLEPSAWVRCPDCGALVLPDGHPEARLKHHDTDCVARVKRRA